MDALGSPHVAGRSRYPHPPPSHHQFLDPDYYPRQLHHPASFPPPPSIPPYEKPPSPPRRHERDLRAPVDGGGGGGGGGGRLYFPYPHPQDPFPQPSPRVPERFPLPDDRYHSPRPHPLVHGEGFPQEHREIRAFNADRFRVFVEENRDLIRLRWEEEERCRLMASCRGNHHVEDLEGDLARRKRMRWAHETDAEENIGGLGQRYHAWDRELDRRRYGCPDMVPRSSFENIVSEGNRESASVVEWRQLQPPISSYSDRAREDWRGENGSVLQRDLRPPELTIRPSMHSYADIPREFLQNNAPLTGHGFQEDYSRGNKGKRKISSNGKDYSVKRSPIKQSAKRPSALSRIQSGISVWNRIQEKPPFLSSASFSPPSNSGKVRGEVSTPKFLLKSNSLVGEALAASSPTLLTSDGNDPEVATMKKTGKKKFVRKCEEISQVTIPDCLDSEMNDEIPKRPIPDPPQNVSNDSQISDNHRATGDANSQNCSMEVAGTVFVDKDIGERTCSHVTCGEDECNNNIENLAVMLSNLTEFAKATEKSVHEDASMIVHLFEAAGNGNVKEKQFVKVGENDVHFVSENDDRSSPFTQVHQQVSVQTGKLQLPSAFSPVDGAHVKQDIYGLGDGNYSTYFDNGIDPSFCEFSSSSPLPSTEQVMMSAGCKSSTLSSDDSLDKHMKWKGQCDGNEQSEAKTATKQLEEIGKEKSTTDDACISIGKEGLSAHLPAQLSDTNPERCLSDCTTDVKDDGLNLNVSVESPQSDSLRPIEESSIVASPVISKIENASTCVVPEQMCPGLHDTYGCIDDVHKQDQSIGTNSLLALKGSSVLEACSFQSGKDTSIKPMLESEKELSSDLSVKQKLVDSRIINKQDHLYKKVISFAGLSTVFPSQANSVTSVKESAHRHHSLRNKTWHRKDTLSTAQVVLQSKRSGSLCKSPKKPGKLQNSYVRKGNSLIRKPSTKSPQSSLTIGTSSKLSNGITEENIDNKSSVKNHTTFPNLPPFERPKTPPLPLVTKLSNCTILSSEAPHSISENPIPEGKADVQGDLLDLASGGGNDINVAREKIPEPWCAKKMIYVKHKSNQLVAASGPKSCDSTKPSEKNQASASLASSDLYYRKKKNQLIRSIFSSNGQDKQDLIAGNKSSDVGRKPTPLRKRLDKAQQKIYKNSTFKHVWTLNRKETYKRGVSSLPHLKVLPYLIPWKRTMYWTNKTTVLKRRSLLLHSRKSQLIRKKDTLYSLSTDGFSLQKAGASHVGRSSLKWSRSMQRRPKIVNKEAALAVAEVERKKRERKKVDSAPHHGNNGNSVLHEQSCAIDQGARNTLDSKKFSGGNNGYIRIGNGNQLVRDPKKLIRILANEKVRWSLHNARLRLAKKQQYCLFFSRFGKCNEKGGKCPFIHDPSKVAICTKFLSGSCSNTGCKLTHKIIPERMPDCSYFLQGLCTNTSCPYRHVNVHPNASICEGFLKGYCADGDECHKQHSFVCPLYKSTGKCLQATKCRLHHPKIKKKCKERKDFMPQSNSWGRYFGSNIREAGEPSVTSSYKDDTQKVEDLFCYEGHFTDFISLGPESNDGDASTNVLMDLSEPHYGSIDSALHRHDLDMLIKPLRIMRKEYTVQSPVADSS